MTNNNCLTFDSVALLWTPFNLVDWGLLCFLARLRSSLFCEDMIRSNLNESGFKIIIEHFQSILSVIVFCGFSLKLSSLSCHCKTSKKKVILGGGENVCFLFIADIRVADSSTQVRHPFHICKNCKLVSVVLSNFQNRLSIQSTSNQCRHSRCIN